MAASSSSARTVRYGERHFVDSRCLSSGLRTGRSWPAPSSSARPALSEPAESSESIDSDEIVTGERLSGVTGRAGSPWKSPSLGRLWNRHASNRHCVMRSKALRASLINSLMAESCSATASSRPMESMCIDTRLTFGFAVPKAERCHHQSDAQIVGGAHRVRSALLSVAPRTARYVVSANGHHGRSSSSEANCHFAVAEAHRNSTSKRYGRRR